MTIVVSPVFHGAGSEQRSKHRRGVSNTGRSACVSKECEGCGSPTRSDLFGPWVFDCFWHTFTKSPKHLTGPKFLVDQTSGYSYMGFDMLFPNRVKTQALRPGRPRSTIWPKTNTGCPSGGLSAPMPPWRPATHGAHRYQVEAWVQSFSEAFHAWDRRSRSSRSRVRRMRWFTRFGSSFVC